MCRVGGDMGRTRWIWFFGSVATLGFSGYLIAQQDQLPVEHPDCTFFGPERERFVSDAMERLGGRSKTRRLSTLTDQVMRAMAVIPGGSQTYTYDRAHTAGSLDSYIFADFKKHGITPAPASTDWEFVRRVTLDLTGRIPTPDRALSFVADG